ncbi:MAG: DUF1501 domain-containing protein [Trueperaceae bacterium]|nr:DUF1501 domain-containing protein [Trueperaceae bacterium]
MQLGRRQFLKSASSLSILGASRALFPSWMPNLAFAEGLNKAPGDVLVNIFLRGGMDGLSAVVPYFEGGLYYDRRPNLSVSEAALTDLDGRFGLHPAMTPLKELYDEGSFAIIHATGSPDDSRSHFDAMQYMEYGTPGEKNIGTGWLGRHLKSAAWQNQSPFRAVGMGTMVAQSLRGPVTPLALKSIADFHYKGRESEVTRLQQSLSSLYHTEAPLDPLGAQAKLVFETVELLQDLNALNYEPSGGASYPDSEFGLGLKQIAQLIKADVGLEVASVDLGGWDTHEGQGTLDGEFNTLLTELSQGLYAFYTDLSGYMQRISVVTMSEFGRRVEENGSSGTDHGHGNVMFAMGGGIAGGQVFCDWPGLSSDALDDGDLAITTDYRDVLAEIVQGRLLNPAIDQIFPKHSFTPLGLVRSRA